MVTLLTQGDGKAASGLLPNIPFYGSGIRLSVPYTCQRLKTLVYHEYIQRGHEAQKWVVRPSADYDNKMFFFPVG